MSDRVAGFQYSYEVCVKKFLGICTKKELKTEYYDLTKPEVRKQFRDMHFTAKVAEKI